MHDAVDLIDVHFRNLRLSLGRLRENRFSAALPWPGGN
jgi:hypothetical protein